MSFTLRRSQQAIDDLADIWAYIAADNEAAADKLLRELLELFDKTADFPALGRMASEVGDDIRILPRGRYLLIYRVEEASETVELIRVVHGARDWARLFEA